MGEKKNLVIITETFPLADCVYAGEFVLQQVLELTNRGYNVTILFPKAALPSVYKFIQKVKGQDFFIPKQIDGLLPDNIKFYFVPFFYYTKFGLKDFLKALGLFLFIKTKNIKVDLIHGHMIYNAGYLSVLVGKWLKKPVVLTAHGAGVNSIFMEEPDVDGLFFHDQSLEQVKQRVITALQGCDKVIAVSNALKDRILKLGTPEDKVTIVYNGVNQEKFYPVDRLKAQTELTLPTDKKIILYVGHLIIRKGVHYLIEALASIKESRDDFLLVLAGYGPLKNELTEQVKKSRLEENVLFAGQIQNNDLPLWYAGCDIFCLPSSREGTPCVIIEAMAAGRYIVSTAVGGVPEVVKDSAVGLLVPLKNPTELAKALNAALDKDYDIKYIRKYSEQFHWHNIIPQIEAVYKEAQRVYIAKA